MKRAAAHPKIAVLGDSVHWGQGLCDEHKFAFLVAHALGTPKRDVFLKAHSGAVVGAGSGGLHTAANEEIPFDTPATRNRADGIPGTSKVDPEIPFDIPIIGDQIDEIPDASKVDLVLLTGGINDVSIWRILDPATSKDRLHKLTREACYTQMKKLLSRAVMAFSKPSCSYVVSGYYPIVSSISELASRKQAAEFDHLLGLYSHGYPLTIRRELVFDTVCALAMQFWHDSDKYLTRAVRDTVSTYGLGNRMLFLRSGFSERNALFADDPWLFGFTSTFLPQDEVKEMRAAACDSFYSSDLLRRELCYYASVGHPNVTGAAKMANAIMKALPKARMRQD